jgi:hypothetical protein
LNIRSGEHAVNLRSTFDVPYCSDVDAGGRSAELLPLCVSWRFDLFHQAWFFGGVRHAFGSKAR